MSAQHAALYRPLEGLEAIRFIELLPGTASDTISVNFVYDTLLMKPPPMFEATSYTWGDPTPTRTILCDGTEFEVRQNAHDFLQQLRLPDRSRMLWMDCICINHQNPDERATQVEMMHAIYRDAMAVIAWIGLQDNSSSLALDYISQLDSRTLLRQHLFDFFLGPSALKSKPYIFDSISSDEHDQLLVASILALLSRSWFRRVWIQQEMVMNRNTRLFCGSREIEFGALLALAYVLRPRDSSGWPEPWVDYDFDPAWRSMEALRNILENRIIYFVLPDPWADHRYDDSPAELATTNMLNWRAHKDGTRSYLVRRFVTLLCRGIVLEATDPRDKVYALYNLPFVVKWQERVAPKGSIKARPAVDYTIPWEMVSVRIAKFLYQTDADATLLLSGRSQQYTDANIPSWAPDLRNVFIENVFAPHSQQWSAGGGINCESPLRFVHLPARRLGVPPIPEYYYFDSKSRKGNGRRRKIVSEAMELGAILLDRIVYCSPQLPLPPGRWSVNAKDVCQKLETDLAFIDENVVTYFTGESGEDAYAGTIIANTTPRDELTAADYEKKGFAEWRAWLTSTEFPNSEPEYHEAVENTEHWTKHLFIVSSHGLMCLVPAMACEDDYVAILSGFRYPVALRKVGPQDGQYYELLGQCYMHRMMRGRAWSLIEEFKLKYRPGSEDEVVPLDIDDQLDDGNIDVFPFNAKSDYRSIVRVLGKRRIVLV